MILISRDPIMYTVVVFPCFFFCYVQSFNGVAHTFLLLLVLLFELYIHTSLHIHTSGIIMRSI